MLCSRATLTRWRCYRHRNRAQRRHAEQRIHGRYIDPEQRGSHRGRAGKCNTSADHHVRKSWSPEFRNNPNIDGNGQLHPSRDFQVTAQATVTFLPPSSNGGNPISGYIVTATTVGALGVATQPGTTSPIVVPGLRLRWLRGLTNQA